MSTEQTTWPSPLFWLEEIASHKAANASKFTYTSSTGRKTTTEMRFLLQNMSSTEFNEFWSSRVLRYCNYHSKMFDLFPQTTVPQSWTDSRIRPYGAPHQSLVLKVRWLETRQCYPGLDGQPPKKVARSCLILWLVYCSDNNSSQSDIYFHNIISIS